MDPGYTGLIDVSQLTISSFVWFQYSCLKSVSFGGGVNSLVSCGTNGNYDPGFKREINNSITFIEDADIVNNELNEVEHTLTILELYPNPVKEYLIVSSNFDIMTLTVKDISGKEVKRIEANTKKLRINTEYLPSGLYFVSVKSLHGSETIKMIKQ